MGGHNGNSDHYVTLEVYGYIPGDSAVVFVATPKNIRTTCNTNTKQTLSMPSDLTVPADAEAVYATISTFDDNRNDHVTHSFGRYNGHQTHTWDNQVYDSNTYLNDVMITHEGDASGKFHYGYSHGTQIIPLTSANQIQAQLCMGHPRGTHYITMEVYGYIPNTSNVNFLATPTNIRTTCTKVCGGCFTTRTRKNPDPASGARSPHRSPHITTSSMHPQHPTNQVS